MAYLQQLCQLQGVADLYLYPRGEGRGDSQLKGVGMLVISLRGVNFGFWSYLRCLGTTPLYLVVKVSFRVAGQEI